MSAKSTTDDAKLCWICLSSGHTWQALAYGSQGLLNSADYTATRSQSWGPGRLVPPDYPSVWHPHELSLGAQASRPPALPSTFSSCSSHAQSQHQPEHQVGMQTKPCGCTGYRHHSSMLALEPLSCHVQYVSCKLLASMAFLCRIFALMQTPAYHSNGLGQHNMWPTSTALVHCRESSTYDELPGWHEALCQPQALAHSHLQAARSKPTLSVA